MFSESCKVLLKDKALFANVGDNPDMFHHPQLKMRNIAMSSVINHFLVMCHCESSLPRKIVT